MVNEMFMRDRQDPNERESLLAQYRELQNYVRSNDAAEAHRQSEREEVS